MSGADGTLYVLRASDGLKMASYSTSGSFQTQPTVAGTDVYIGDIRGALYALRVS